MQPVFNQIMLPKSIAFFQLVHNDKPVRRCTSGVYISTLRLEQKMQREREHGKMILEISAAYPNEKYVLACVLVKTGECFISNLIL
jgi:hypothetical protein